MEGSGDGGVGGSIGGGGCSGGGGSGGGGDDFNISRAITDNGE